MNGENKFLKLFYIIAFIAFACVSCWATAESFHMLLPTWPVFAVYIVTIGFFFIASLGTKMIVDSLNQNIIYLEKRGLRLIGGLLITLVFWLICSMPTNTHTFFYRSVANSIAKEDVITTVGYLDQLVNDTRNEEQIKLKQNALDNNVKSKLQELEREIKNPLNEGIGPNALNIIDQLAVLLNVAKIDTVSYRRPLTTARRDVVICEYRRIIDTLADIKKESIRKSIEPTNKNIYQEKARNAKEIIDSVAEIMDKDPSVLNDISFAHKLDNSLLTGYATVKTYKDFVEFNPKTDEARYSAPNPITKIKQLMSVFDVWKDVFRGLYKGHGFVFWILISILVDIAAFIFFDLAFKKED